MKVYASSEIFCYMKATKIKSINNYFVLIKSIRFTFPTEGI